MNDALVVGITTGVLYAVSDIVQAAFKRHTSPWNGLEVFKAAVVLSFILWYFLG